MYCIKNLKKIKEAINILNSPLTTPEFLNKNYFPSLDGWRAVAVLIVIIGHFKLTLEKENLIREILKITVFAELGVKMFFVLSGFLITTLLIKEKLKYGKVNIVNFFVRRFLRIFPILYIYLLAVYLVNIFFDLKLVSDNFIGPLLYLNNFDFYNKTWLTGHTWSLAVEEQFYIIWPFLFTSIKGKILICSLILLLIPLLKVIAYIYPNANDVLLIPFLIPASSIFTGCLLSLITFNDKLNIIISNNRNFKNAYLFISILFIYTVHYFTSKGIFGKIMLPFGDLITDFIIAYLLLFSVLKRESLFFRILNSNLFIQIGLISYSLYIWQQLFIIQRGYYPNYQSHLYFPLNIILTFAVAYCSYHCFEKPILKFKRKFSIH